MSKDDTKRCIVGVIIRESGQILSLFVIREGNRAEAITNREVDPYKMGPVYVCQEVT